MHAHFPEGCHPVAVGIGLGIVRHARIELIQIAPLHFVGVDQPVVIRVEVARRRPIGVVFDGLEGESTGIRIPIRIKILVGFRCSFPTPDMAIPCVVFLNIR